LPSAIAGISVVGAAGQADGAVDEMAVPGLPTAGQGPGVLAQGDAQLHRAPHNGGWLLVDGCIEQASAEVRPELVRLRRDPLGVRPMYYALSPDARRLGWASRPTQLLHLAWVDRRPSWDGLLDVLTAAGRDQGHTCWTGIRQLPPGHRLDWRPGRTTSLIQEWDPSAFAWDGGPGPPRPAEEFAARLEQAVARRVDAGTTLLLSGGLDSSSVAAAAARRRLRPPTLSLSLPGFPSADETDRVLDVRARLDLDGELLEVLPDGVECIDDELALHGEPHFMLNHNFLTALLKAAAAGGGRTTMTGHYGDDVLGRMSGLGPLLLRRPKLAVEALGYLAAAGRPRRRTIAGWLYECAPRWAKRVAAPLPWLPSRRPPAPWLSRDLFQRHRDPISPRRSWRAAQLLIGGAHTARAALVADRAAAAAGVDLRQPFADRELVEFALSLPPEAKHAGGRMKALVRDGFPELPASVRERPGKTSLTEASVAAHPMAAMAGLLCEPPSPVPGVDYDALRARLAAGTPYVGDELPLMRRLALIHRFLAGLA